MPHEAWMLKRRLTSYHHDPAIDDIYSAARARAVRWGQIVWSRRRGFMLLFARPEDHERIRHSSFPACSRSCLSLKAGHPNRGFIRRQADAG